MPTAIYCVAHSGTGHGVETKDKISEFQLATAVGKVFEKTLHAAKWDCMIVSGAQEIINQRANALRAADPEAFALELHMNAPGPNVANPRFGHMVEHHKGNKVEHALARRVDSMIKKLLPSSRLLTVVEQPDPNFPNRAFLIGHPAGMWEHPFAGIIAPAFLVEAGFAMDPVFANFVKDPENQGLLGWALASAVVGYEVLEDAR